MAHKKNTVAFKLDNGLRVFIVPSTHTHETIVRLTIENGSNSEATQRQHGLSHFVEHLIFKGSGSRRDSDVDGTFLDLLKDDKLPVSETDTDYVARLHGATYNASTTNVMTSFYYKSHAKHTKFFVSWLSLILRKWDFDSEMIDSEKGPITQELAMGLQQFGRQGIYRILENLYTITEAPHFKTIGTVKSITNATSDSLSEYFNRVYTANNAHLIVCGNVPAVDMLVSHIRDVYVNLRVSEQTPIFPRVADVTARMEKTHTVRYSSDPMGQTMYGMRVQHETPPELVEMFQKGCDLRIRNSLIGSGLCSDACMFIEKQTMYEAVVFIMFVVAKPVGEDTFSECNNDKLNEINEQISKVIAQPWTKAELASIGHSCTVDYVKSYIQSIEDFSYNYSAHQVMYKDSDVYGGADHQKSYISSITTDDMDAFASKINLKYRAGFGQEYAKPDTLKVHSVSSHPQRTSALGEVNMDKYFNIADPVYNSSEFDVKHKYIDGNIFIRNKRNAVFNSITMSPLVPSVDRFTVKSIERKVFDRAIQMTSHFTNSNISQDESITPSSFSFPAVETMDEMKEKINQFRSLRSKAFSSINTDMFSAAVSSVVMEHYSHVSDPVGATFDHLKNRFILDQSSDGSGDWSPDNVKKHLMSLDVKSMIANVQQHNEMPLLVTCNFNIDGYDRVADKAPKAPVKRIPNTSNWQGEFRIEQAVPQYYVTHSRPGMHLSNNPDYHTKGKMFEFVFCGGLGSRLLQLRTNYGWMYSLWGKMSQFNGVDHSGIDFITTQLDKSVLDKYLEKITEMTSVKYWQENPITMGEFVGAKEMVSNTYLRGLSEHSIGDTVSRSGVVQDYAERMNMITIEDLQQFAEAQASVGFDYVVIVGPKTIEDKKEVEQEQVDDISDKISSITF